MLEAARAQAGRRRRRRGRRGGDPRPGRDRPRCWKAWRRLPPRIVEYRGTRLEEFDLDAALARRPPLLLVDELAHTNAPGSRHAKRWQDVDELLDAGIDVYTTLNVQHLESLNDVVAQITGVTVRETVPDSVLERADEVELVDVTADVLLQRLREGKVYVPEQASRAHRALLPQGQPDRAARARAPPHRRAGGRADARLHGGAGHPGDLGGGGAAAGLHRAEPDHRPARARRSPHGGPAARRMDRGSRGDPAAISGSPRTDRENILRALELAEQLGGRTVTLSGQSVADEILAYARDAQRHPHHCRQAGAAGDGASGSAVHCSRP